MKLSYPPAAATYNGRGCKVPLDRPITIGIRGADDHNAAGQFVPGVVVEYPAWATLLDNSEIRTLDGPARGGGARIEQPRTYRARWFEELALAPVTSVSVTDDLGLTYTVTNVSEYTGRFSDLRRRFLDIECNREGQT